MGMANSAQAFQRLVESVIGDMEGVFCYLDDLLIYSKSHQEHLKILEEVFKKLSNAGLSLSLSKCSFGVPAVDYLGYRVDKTGLTPMAKKVEALQSFPPPQKQKDVLAFLGALNYYRSSLPRLSPEDSVTPTSVTRSPAEVLDPLYKLATCTIEKKKDQFKKIWEANTNLQNAFQTKSTLKENWF